MDDRGDRSRYGFLPPQPPPPAAARRPISQPRIIGEIGGAFEFLGSHPAMPRQLAPTLAENHLPPFRIVTVDDRRVSEPFAFRPAFLIVRIRPGKFRLGISSESLGERGVQIIAFLIPTSKNDHRKTGVNCSLRPRE